MHKLSFDSATLDEARRFNRTLARMPRFKMRRRWAPRLLQALLRLGQVGADRRLARLGIDAERRLLPTAGAQVPVRILRPRGPVRAVVLDIHGGGWVIGNARMNDKLNAATIAACAVAVVSVDYRLALASAPDAPLAGPMDDCLAAARWLLEGGLPEYAGLPVFFVGESAGGHLAAATLLRLQAWPELLRRVHGAVLYYGVYDLAGSPSVHGAGPGTLVLDGPGMPEALRRLTPGLDDAARRQAPLSPLYGDMSGLPPALLFAGELDPLRDDTTAMAARWRGAAEVELQLLPETPHGVIHFPTLLARLVTAHGHAWLRARIDTAHGEAHGEAAMA